MKKQTWFFGVQKRRFACKGACACVILCLCGARPPVVHYLQLTNCVCICSSRNCALACVWAHVRACCACLRVVSDDQRVLCACECARMRVFVFVCLWHACALCTCVCVFLIAHACGCSRVCARARVMVACACVLCACVPCARACVCVCVCALRLCA